MATKVGTMKVKSKSETNQKRAIRPAKYRSMTLRRQEAKLDVTFNENSFNFDESSILAESSMLAVPEDTSIEGENSPALNRSLIDR